MPSVFVNYILLLILKFIVGKFVLVIYCACICITLLQYILDTRQLIRANIF